MKIQSNNFKKLGLIPTPSSIKKLDLNFPFAKTIDIEFDKEEVKDIREGSECGAGFENYNDLQVGDFIECFEIKEIARTLESVQNEANAS